MLATALLVFASNFVILPLPGSEFVPETNSETATVIGELPPGTALEASSAAARRWESILLMFMILAILYENWLQPLLILTALPLATVGAFLGLLLFGQSLSVPSFIGLIALFGLVGKNAILLVDRANDLRRQGLDRTAALEQAGPSRLRPILMTSVVLVLSMLPVALKLGDGGEVRAPLGAVLVGGMATSTFLALLYVPVAYTYFDSVGALLGRLLGRLAPAPIGLSVGAAVPGGATAPSPAAVAPLATGTGPARSGLPRPARVHATRPHRRAHQVKRAARWVADCACRVPLVGPAIAARRSDAPTTPVSYGGTPRAATTPTSNGHIRPTGEYVSIPEQLRQNEEVGSQDSLRDSGQ